MDFELKNFLIPIDFSVQSRKALTYAQAFVERFGGVVHLVHVVEPAPVAAGMEVAAIPAEYPNDPAELEPKLAEEAKLFSPGSVGRVVVREGSAVDEITSVARELRIDLIILSSHGHSGIRRVFFGSTAEGVVRKAPCSVLVLRPQERELITPPKDPGTHPAFALKTILVSVDFSDASRRALGYAIAFARRFGAKIICVHVLEFITYTDPDTTLAEQVERVRRELFEATERTLEDFLKDQTTELPRENILTTGSASREIIRLAEDRKAELIIVGRYGQTCAGRFILGSTAERVIRHADCPVLVVREQEA